MDSADYFLSSLRSFAADDSGSFGAIKWVLEAKYEEQIGARRSLHGLDQG